MTEPVEKEEVKPKRPLLTLALGWFRWSISLKMLIVDMAVLGAVVGLYIFVGGIGISADSPDGWLARHGLHFVFKRSVASASNRVTPPGDLSSPFRVRLAAQHFDMVCANCHGRPGFGQSVVALSMSPRPQYLPKVVGQFTDSELYVIVEHGVKYSAMPSWAAQGRGDEVWSMVAFLRQLPKLDGAAYRTMTALPAVDVPALAEAAAGAPLRPGDTRHEEPPVDEFQYAAPASGFSDQTIHNNPVATCARCHGADGSGAVTGGEAPNLTIQSAAYLHAALEAYVNGARKSGYMRTIATELSDDQIAALSNYYAGLPIKTASASDPASALAKRGEAIAMGGIPESAIPACSNCHESEGAKIIGAPYIAGQSATYLRRQLLAMGGGGRGSSVVWNPMYSVAHDLSDSDIAALAAYYSGLKPGKARSDEPVAPPPHEALPTANFGQSKAIFETVCTKCHINGGRGDPQGNYPNLTIQTKVYAAQSLYAFNTGARLSDKMRQVTDGLSLAQMTSLSYYINGLNPLAGLGAVDKAAASRGEAIATNGIVSRGVPACLSCHGAKGIAALPLIPPLQGQNVAYLNRKLDTFSKPYLENHDGLNPMPAIARKLTDQERGDIAAYFAAAAPLQKPPAHP